MSIIEITDPVGLDVMVPAIQAADAERRKRAIEALLGDDQGDNTQEGANPQNNGRWLNQTELAKHLGVHPTTVRRWNLPCCMLGRLPRYQVSEVERHMKSKAFKRHLEMLKRERGAMPSGR